MNPVLHSPLFLEVAPTNESFSKGRDLFDLGMRYKPEGAMQYFFNVHVPLSLQVALRAGQVKSIHLETLERNGVVSRALEDAPHYLVVGVITEAGDRFLAIPVPLRRRRSIYYWAGVFGCLIGGIALFSSHFLTGAIVLVAGSHAIRTALTLRIIPFKVVEEHC